MSNKVKSTNFENIYYYRGCYILIDEKTKMWYFSNYDLFKMFLEEKENVKYTIYGNVIKFKFYNSVLC